MKQMVRKFNLAFVALFISLAISACGGGGDSSSSGLDYRGQYLSATMIGGGVGLSGGYKLEYATTDPTGALVTASGLLTIPLTDAQGLMSVQHYTITKESDAPSYGVNWEEAYSGQQLDMITMTADYIGYGATKDYVHTYMIASSLASASLDMIRATKEYLAEKEISYVDKLYLMGYSEGGYATIALQKEIEQNRSGEFTITASFVGGTAFDFYNTAVALITADSMPVPSFVAFVPYAYDATYGWDRPMTDYFNEPYASLMDDLFDGSYDSTDIDAQLSDDPNELFAASLVTALTTGVGEETFIAALKANDLYNWGPQVPTGILHGVNDTIIPYANATTGYNGFIANGAPDVELIPCSEGDGEHDDCGWYFFELAVDWFAQY